jgi:hypothetical protein
MAMISGGSTAKEKAGTNGMADSKSLIVRSGIMTSFCATTLVTPSLLTVFIAEGGIIETKEQSERKTATKVAAGNKKMGLGAGVSVNFSF